MEKAEKITEKYEEMNEKNNGAIVLTNAHLDKKNKTGKNNKGGCC